MTKLNKTDKKGTMVVGAGGSLAIAALAATDFLDPDLLAELTEKITTGGLTINSIITAVAVYAISNNIAKTRKLQSKLDELITDAETPPTKPADNDEPTQ